MPKRRVDQAYLDWLSYQPSWLDQSWHQWDEVRGVGRNIPCHVSRANNHGIAIKALWSAVPMTQKQHDYQSHHGELACILRYRPQAGVSTVEQAKELFDKTAEIHLNRWRGLQK